MNDHAAAEAFAQSLERPGQGADDVERNLAACYLELKQKDRIDGISQKGWNVRGSSGGPVTPVVRCSQLRDIIES